MFARSTCKIFRLYSSFSSNGAPRTTLLSNLTVKNANSLQFRRIYHQKPPQTGATAYEGAFSKLWSNMFGKYLFATNVISSGVLMVVGDVIAQYIEKRNAQETELDYQRVWRMFLVGAAQGPLHHWVYAWMDRVMPAPTIKNVVKKILIDQIFMSPICILLFYYTACYLEKKCLQETHAEIIDKFPLIYAFDWLLWPGAQYVNFRYLDTKYRVFFVNICTALYNIFISYIKHEDDQHHIGTIPTNHPDSKAQNSGSANK